MSVKPKSFSILIASLLFLSLQCFSQNQKANADSILWWKFNFLGSDDYPQSLIQSKQSVVAFCRVKFSTKKKNVIESIDIFNTDNEEIIEKLQQRVQKIDFTKFKEKFTMILVPFIFKSFDEITDNSINLKESTLARIFDKSMGYQGRYTCKFLSPVYFPYYSPQPPKH